MTIKLLKIECDGIPALNATINPQGEEKVNVFLSEVPLLELMASVIAQKSVEDVLGCITNHDIELYMKGQNNE